jgi:hypothetical protein
MKELKAKLREQEVLLYGMACRWRNATWPQIAEMAGFAVPPVGYKTKPEGFTRKDFSGSVSVVVRAYAASEKLPFPKRQYEV